MNSNTYLITTPAGETQWATFGDVLYELNFREHQDTNPYTDLATIKVTMPSGEVCAVKRFGNDLAPDLADPSIDESRYIALFDEVEPYFLKFDASIKTPAEMTHRQWGAANAVGSLIYGLYGARPTRFAYTNAYKVWIDRIGYGHNGPHYGNGHDTNSRHDVHVEYALLIGLPVAPQNISDYAQNPARGFDGRARAAAQCTFAHGKFPVPSVFHTLHRMAMKEGLLFNEATLPTILKALEGISGNPSHIEIDDALYAAGLVQPLTYDPQQVFVDKPLNDFAANLRNELAKASMQKQVERLGKDLADRKISKRWFERSMTEIQHNGATHLYDYANKTAQALLDRNVHVLLSVLDRPDQLISKRAVEIEYGIKLIGVKAAARRRAVLALAGFITDAEVESFEREELEREQKCSAARALTDARERAQDKKIRYEGQVYTADAFVDVLIARGYTQFVTDNKGAAITTHLYNPETQISYRMTNSNGTLPYARAALADRERRGAVTQPTQVVELA